MNALRDRYVSWKNDNPRGRIRDAANALAVSELELLLASDNPTVTRLDRDWAALVEGLQAVGRVMVLTRNEAVVHERVGRFEKVHMRQNMGGVYGPDIDLRLMLMHWAYAVAAEVPNRRGALPSIQIFGKQGQALFKVYLKDDGDRDAWDALIATRSEGDVPEVTLQPAPAPPTPSGVDVDAFRSDWEALTDTHEFFGMLRRHGVARRRAMELAPRHRTRQLSLDVLEPLLSRVADADLPIMVFVSSGGVVQIHSGPVKRIAPMNDWLNVLDPDFNLHVDTSKLDTVWWVSKPTDRGGVHAIEVYDAAGTLVLQVFGKRNEQQGERPDWRALLEELRDTHGVG